jgi:hypothetical protein
MESRLYDNRSSGCRLRHARFHRNWWRIQFNKIGEIPSTKNLILKMESMKKAFQKIQKAY